MYFYNLICKPTPLLFASSVVRSISGGVVCHLGGGIKPSNEKVNIDRDVIERIQLEAREAEAKALGIDLDEDDADRKKEVEEEPDDEW